MIAQARPHDPDSQTSDTPTVRQDIDSVLLHLVDALDKVQTGLTAFMLVAADNDSEFARTAHWMVGQIDANFGHAFSMASAAQDASRVERQRTDRDRASAAEEAAERLREFAETEPEALPHMTAQKAIDGAVTDAVFVLARAMSWGQYEPMVDGLRRAGAHAAAFTARLDITAESRRAAGFDGRHHPTPPPIER